MKTKINYVTKRGIRGKEKAERLRTNFPTPIRFYATRLVITAKMETKKAVTA